MGAMDGVTGKKVPDCDVNSFSVIIRHRRSLVERGVDEGLLGVPKLEEFRERRSFGEFEVLSNVLDHVAGPEYKKWKFRMVEVREELLRKKISVKNSQFLILLIAAFLIKPSI